MPRTKKPIEMRIEYMAISALPAAPRNPKSHDLNVIKQSIRKFGFNDPVAINEYTGNLIEGHGRIEALGEMVKANEPLPTRVKLIDGEWNVPVLRGISFKSDKQAEAYLLAHNQATMRAGWDEDLGDMLRELDESIDVEVVGWSDAEIRSIVQLDAHAKDEVEVEEDAVPALPKKAITKHGDKWELGRHVLICGSTGSDAVARHIPSNMTISLVTDPPYCSGGFQEASRSAGSIGRRSQFGHKISNDRLSTQGYTALMRAMLDQFNAQDVHIFTEWRQWATLFNVTEATGILVRSMIVWKKPSAGLGLGWRAQHELVLYGSRTSPKFKSNRGNVIECKRSRNELHATQKPVELMSELVKMAGGELIVDAFAGSGSTLIACEHLSRSCLAVEVDPAHCDVIVERWQKVTGGKAVRRRQKVA